MKKNHVAEKTVIHYVTLTPNVTMKDIVEATGLKQTLVHRILTNNAAITRDETRYPYRYRVDSDRLAVIVNSAERQEVVRDLVTEVDKWRAAQDKALAEDEHATGVFLVQLAKALNSGKAQTLSAAVVNANKFANKQEALDIDLQADAKESLATLRRTLYNFYRKLEDIETDPRFETAEGWTLYVEKD